MIGHKIETTYTLGLEELCGLLRKALGAPDGKCSVHPVTTRHVSPDPRESSYESFNGIKFSVIVET